MNHNNVMNGGTLPAKSSLGDFIKRLTPTKYRSRSKSPMMRDGVLLAGHNSVMMSDTCQSSSKNGSWVKVEFKQQHQPQHQQYQSDNNVVRHTTLPKASTCQVTRSDTADCLKSNLKKQPASFVYDKNGKQQQQQYGKQQEMFTDGYTGSMPNSPMSASAIYYSNSSDFLADMGSAPNEKYSPEFKGTPAEDAVEKSAQTGTKKSPKNSAAASSITSPFGSFFTRNSLKREKKLSAGSGSGTSSGNLNKISAAAENYSPSIEERPSKIKACSNKAPDHQNSHHNSAKHRFDAFVAQISHRRGRQGRQSQDSGGDDLLTPVNQTGTTSRIAISEENLVSKSLSLEKSIVVNNEIGGVGDISAPSGAALINNQSGASIVVAASNNVNSAHHHFPTNTVAAAVTSQFSTPPLYHSQDSVFDTTSSSLAHNHVTPSVANGGRVPSYVKLSCTLSGYKNYRSIDLRSASPSRVSPCSGPISPRLTIFDPQGPEICIGNDKCQPSSESKVPLGKSLVERRLETFNAMQNGGASSPPENLHINHSASNNSSTGSNKESSSSLNKKLAYDCATDDGSNDILHNHQNGTDDIPAVPVKDIIENFNKKSPPTVPPRPRTLKTPPSGLIENSRANEQINGNNVIPINQQEQAQRHLNEKIAEKNDCSRTIPTVSSTVGASVFSNVGAIVSVANATVSPTCATVSSTTAATVSHPCSTVTSAAVATISHASYCSLTENGYSGAAGKIDNDDVINKNDSSSETRKNQVLTKVQKGTIVDNEISLCYNTDEQCTGQSGGIDNYCANESACVVSGTKIFSSEEKETIRNHVLNDNDDDQIGKTRRINVLNGVELKNDREMNGKIVETRENNVLKTGFNENCEKSNTQSTTFLNVENGESAKTPLTETMDGHFYANLSKRERTRLENLAKMTENYLYEPDIPEHAAEEIRTVVGKLNLLLRKKFTMFESLVEKNLHPIPDDPRPALNSDLDGYWQLVKIELTHVDRGFDRIERSRRSGWRQLADDDVITSSASGTLKSVSGGTGTAKNRTVPRNTATTDAVMDDSSTTSSSANRNSPNPSSTNQQQDDVKETARQQQHDAKEAARQKRLRDAKLAALERKKAAAEENSSSDNVQFYRV